MAETLDPAIQEAHERLVRQESVPHPLSACMLVMLYLGYARSERQAPVIQAARALRTFADECCCEDHEREAIQRFDAALAMLDEPAQERR